MARVKRATAGERSDGRASWDATAEHPGGQGHVEGFQRARILGAMVEVALERGASEVTVAHVVSRAGVSRRTFYEIFSDREDCLLAALEDGLERVAVVVVPAYDGKGTARGARGWRERIRTALVELLGLFDEDPGLARLVVVESLAAGPRALERRNIVLERLIAVVDEGRTLTGISGKVGAGAEPPALTAEGVVGAVSSILYARLAGTRTGEAEQQSLIELTGPLMGMIVLPYLGKAAAARELARPVPTRRASSVRVAGNYPFRDLGMRLTYRTLRVLDAVAANPDASNRLVGTYAGIADQGQISKLLSRLKRLGMIDNVAGPPGTGAPNAWRLTEKGWAMQQAVESPRGSAHDRTTFRRGWVT
jgi:AcrR family transcriptional regulator